MEIIEKNEQMKAHVIITLMYRHEISAFCYIRLALDCFLFNVFSARKNNFTK